MILIESETVEKGADLNINRCVNRYDNYNLRIIIASTVELLAIIKIIIIGN